MEVTDSESLQGWLMKLGEDSTRLCTSVETVLDWLANEILSCAAYCAFILGRLIALDKQPGVCPVGVEEMWRFLFANILVKVMVPE